MQNTEFTLAGLSRKEFIWGQREAGGIVRRAGGVGSQLSLWERSWIAVYRVGFAERSCHCQPGLSREEEVTGEEGEGGTNWEIKTDIHTLPCVKQVASGHLL